MPSPIPMNALTFFLGLSTSLTTMAVAEGTTVEAVETKTGWQINQDGVHYAVRGVGGGESDLARVRSSATRRRSGTTATYERPRTQTGAYSDDDTGRF